jgi:lipopolysaccharide transport system ATP-binding protein
MGEVARGGRTVLFVSHNMVAIKTLCDRVLLLRLGRMLGDSRSVVDAIGSYQSESRDLARIWRNSDSHYQNKYLVPVALSVSETDRTIDVEFVADILQAHADLNITLIVRTLDGQVVLCSTPRDTADAALRLLPGRRSFTCRVPSALLNSIGYRFEMLAVLHNIESLWALGAGPEVSLTVPLKANVTHFWGQRIGAVAPILEWTETSCGPLVAPQTGTSVDA